MRRDFLPTFESRNLIHAAGDLLPEPAEGDPLTGPPEGDALPGPPEREGRVGRGPVRVIPAGPLGEAVVRPGRRGGLPGRVLQRRYLLGDRALDELVLAERLRWKGVPVAEPLAAVREERLPGYRTAVVTRRASGEPLSRLLGKAGDPREAEQLLARAARAVRRLHEAGGWHADLNAANLVLAPDADGPATLVDFDRGRALPAPLPRALARRNVARLQRSLDKLGLDAALAAWPRFLEAYEREACERAASPRPLA